jgi:hypothetical protein
LQFLVNFLIIFPWTMVLALTWLLNTWQLLFRPIGGALWYAVDWLDQRMPTLVEWILWGVYQVSLMLHVVTVGIDLGVIWVSLGGKGVGTEQRGGLGQLRAKQQAWKGSGNQQLRMS